MLRRELSAPPDLDERLRSAAFAYLDRLVGGPSGLVTRGQLEDFVFEGQRMPLVNRQQGIRKPAILTAALSILTTYVAPNETPPYRVAEPSGRARICSRSGSSGSERRDRACGHTSG
jgi:putative restriction endonuclease